MVTNDLLDLGGAPETCSHCGVTLRDMTLFESCTEFVVALEWATTEDYERALKASAVRSKDLSLSRSRRRTWVKVHDLIKDQIRRHAR